MNHEIEAIAYKPGDGAPPRTEIRAPGIHEPISHYTDAVQAGDFLFVSGQGPFDDALGLPGDTMTAQATQMHDNLQRIMAGPVSVSRTSRRSRRISTTATNAGSWMRCAGNISDPIGRPAPCSAANRLALDGMKVELDAICYRPGGGRAR